MDTLLKANQEMVRFHGLNATAVELGMSSTSLHSRIYGIKGMSLRHEHLMQLQHISGTTLYAQAVACESGGAFYELPAVGDLDGADLSDKILEMHEMNGLLASTFREAKKDDCIDAAERADLEKIFHALHKSTQEVRGVMFAVYCKQEA